MKTKPPAKPPTTALVPLHKAALQVGLSKHNLKSFLSEQGIEAVVLNASNPRPRLYLRKGDVARVQELLA